MAGAVIEVSMNDAEVRQALNGAMVRLFNMITVMKIIGATIVASVGRNFESQGRPDKWAPLSPVTLSRRKVAKRGARRGKTSGILLVSGRLFKSINYRATEQEVSIGTNVIYGAVQQFGAKKGAFGATKRGAPIPWGDIPARPYLAVQDEDWSEIAREINDYIFWGRKK
jgi:phage virion morphogenesis protein